MLNICPIGSHCKEKRTLSPHDQVSCMMDGIWHRSKRVLRFPLFANLELPPQWWELVPKAKYPIWNQIWLHIVGALRSLHQQQSMNVKMKINKNQSCKAKKELFFLCWVIVVSLHLFETHNWLKDIF